MSRDDRNIEAEASEQPLEASQEVLEAVRDEMKDSELYDEGELKGWAVDIQFVVSALDEAQDSSADALDEVVINTQFGGFSISEEAVEWLREHDYDAGEECTLPGEYYDDGSGPVDDYKSSFGFRLDRDDPGVVEVVRQLGSKASGEHASLSIVEVPSDVDWVIDEYDGQEKVVDPNASWR